MPFIAGALDRPVHPADLHWELMSEDAETTPQEALEKAVADSRRVSTTGDIEVATYLEIAQGERVRGGRPYQDTTEPETVIIMDFGSQYSHLIARRVREANVFCEIVPHSAKGAVLENKNVVGIILSGGPNSVYEDDAPLIPGWVFDAGVPILGICYGMQALAHQLGGKVTAGLQREYGYAVIHRDDQTTELLEGLDEASPVWMSHGDRIETLPPGFKSLAYSENSPVAAIGNDAGIFGIQFHPEVAHTPQGAMLLSNFVHKICGAASDWTPGHFVTEAIERIKQQVGAG